MMTLEIQPQTVPLHKKNNGTILVGKSRVRLDTVVYAFNQGFTAEEIVRDFPSLKLADIYVVIAYYLNNRAAVDAYVRQGEMEALHLKKQIELKPEYTAFRRRILNRWQHKQQ